MKTKLIVEKNDKLVREIGIYSNQEALDWALLSFKSSLQEGEYLATVPLEPILEIEEDKSALQMAEDEYDWAQRVG